MEKVVNIQELTPEIAQITMQDEIHKNMYSKALMRELIEAFEIASSNTNYKAVILTGYGHYFATGGTQEGLLALADGQGQFTDFNIYSLALDCPIPVISAMQGHGIGGGFVMGLFADFVLLSRESIYSTNFMKYGFTPGVGATYIVPKKLGVALGHEMLLGAQSYQGEELKQRGVPFSVLPRSEVLEKAYQIAQSLAEKPRVSLVTLKKHLVDQLRKDLPDIIESGTLNKPILKESLKQIADRHEVLRTHFTSEAGQVVQVISAVEEFSLGVIAVDNEQQLAALCEQDAQHCFELSEPGLYRTTLFSLNEEMHVLLINIHHSVIDGWSLMIFCRELVALYTSLLEGASPRLSPLPIQYADYAHWQREYLQGAVLEEQLSYWKNQLAALPTVSTLRTDRARPATQTYQGEVINFTLGEVLSAQLTALSRECDVTLFMTLLSAYQVLLSHYAGQNDVAVGSPIAGRTREEFEQLMGFFVNTLVLRADVSADPSFRELLAQVRETTLQAYAHQDIPFEQLVDALQPERSQNHSPLFQTMFVLQNTEQDELELPGIDVSLYPLSHTVAKFDLTLNIMEIDGALCGGVEYNTDLFDASTIERFIGHYQRLLEGIVGDAERPVSHYPLLSEEERYQQLVVWNDTAAEYPQTQCIHELFEEQVIKAPDAIAVVFEDEELSYQELDNRSTVLGKYLQSKGVGPDDLVAICVDRSLEMIVGLLGILKAGGAYVPLDPEYPKERLQYMLSDSDVSLVLSQQHLASKLQHFMPEAVGITFLDHDWEIISQTAKIQPSLHRQVNSSDLAYVIYTSGSTGRPKGVMIEHGALTNFLVSMGDTPGMASDDRLLSVTTYCFDIAALELYLPLLRGAQCFLFSKEISKDVNLLKNKIADVNPTIMQATPSTWMMLFQSGWENVECIKALCGGEALPSVLKNYFCRTGSDAWNMFGPTETTIWSTTKKIIEDNSITIGQPINNTQVYVLNSNLDIIPVGASGELCIAGDGLARGYLNQPNLTAEKFIDNPFKVGTQLYRTGDLARWLSDGNIEYLGRMDDQVKIRGFRIELGEIESQLNNHSSIRRSAVVVKEQNKNKHIIAYYMMQDDQSIASEALKTHLLQYLPEYMLPAVFIALDSIPLTPNGKIDKKQLVTQDVQLQSAQEYVAPRTEQEMLLASIWCDVLDLDKVSVYDDFFEVGGNSILILQLNEKIKSELGVNIQLGAIFSYSTVEQLAIFIESDGKKLFKELPLVAIQKHGINAPLFCVHPIGGTVFCYFELSKILGNNQPVYGLQAQGLEEGEEPHKSIEEAAKHYLDAVKKQQPEGPYQLLGWSLGGVIAFEMALQLQKQGERVLYLGLLDSYPMESLENNFSNASDNEIEAAFIDEMLDILLGCEFKKYIAELQGVEDKLLKIIDIAKREGRLPPGSDIASMRRSMDVYKNFFRTFNDYKLDVCSFKIDYFHAVQNMTDGSLKNRQPKDIWLPYLERGMNYHRIDCRHSEMVSKKAIKVVGSKILLQIRRTYI